MTFKHFLIFLGKIILWGCYVGIIFINFISIPIYDSRWMYVLYCVTSILVAVGMPSLIWWQSNHIEKLYKIIEEQSAREEHTSLQ